MTKGLEALKRIRQETCPATYMADFDKNQCCDDIEKELKAFEIVKEKEVNLGMLETCKTLKEYNAGCRIFGRNQLTEEEFMLLKEASDHE